MLDAAKVYPVTFHPDAGCNTTDEIIRAQVDANMRRGLPQVQPHAPNPNVAVLVCGGPSLNDCEKELVEAVWRGGKVITVNGAYEWCLKRNIRPAATVMLDAREFNKRFVETAVPDCKYLLASQCHPATFDLCADRDTYIWHACSGGDEELAAIRKYYFDRTYPVTIGTTVAIRAISLLRMLGFEWIDVFGLDSCWLGGTHHAYSQNENDIDQVLSVWLRPQAEDGAFVDSHAQHFSCSPWHVKQAQDFLDLVKDRGESFHLNVHGPGLIATMIKTGADLSVEQRGQNTVISPPTASLAKEN